jgi:hypothetical protein
MTLFNVHFHIKYSSKSKLMIYTVQNFNYYFSHVPHLCLCKFKISQLHCGTQLKNVTVFFFNCLSNAISKVSPIHPGFYETRDKTSNGVKIGERACQSVGPSHATYRFR